MSTSTFSLSLVQSTLDSLAARVAALSAELRRPAGAATGVSAGDAATAHAAELVAETAELAPLFGRMSESFAAGSFAKTAAGREHLTARYVAVARELLALLTGQHSALVAADAVDALEQAVADTEDALSVAHDLAAIAGAQAPLMEDVVVDDESQAEKPHKHKKRKPSPARKTKHRQQEEDADSGTVVYHPEFEKEQEQEHEDEYDSGTVVYRPEFDKEQEQEHEDEYNSGTVVYHPELDKEQEHKDEYDSGTVVYHPELDKEKEQEHKDEYDSGTVVHHPELDKEQEQEHKDEYDSGTVVYHPEFDKEQEQEHEDEYDSGIVVHHPELDKEQEQEHKDEYDSGTVVYRPELDKDKKLRHHQTKRGDERDVEERRLEDADEKTPLVSATKQRGESCTPCRALLVSLAVLSIALTFAIIIFGMTKH